jgi:hypothetical protein
MASATDTAPALKRFSTGVMESGVNFGGFKPEPPKLDTVFVHGTKPEPPICVPESREVALSHRGLHGVTNEVSAFAFGDKPEPPGDPCTWVSDSVEPALSRTGLALASKAGFTV